MRAPDRGSFGSRTRFQRLPGALSYRRYAAIRYPTRYSCKDLAVEPQTVAATAAAIAAGGSWASVLLLRAESSRAQEPHLFAEMHVRFASNKLELFVSNAGPGTAFQPIFAIATRGAWSAGDVAPPVAHLSTGQTKRVDIELPALAPDQEIVGIAACLDSRGRLHTWDLTSRRRKVSYRVRRLRKVPLAETLLERTYKGVRVADMRKLRATVPRSAAVPESLR